MRCMSRWEPDASGRLRQAAIELYVERGFAQTTAAQIADRAGLTARTFFRYFGDKREVLFDKSALLQQGMTDALAAAPDSASPLTAVAAALSFAADRLGQDREWSRQRQGVIVANSELQERELIKMASLAAALGEGLRGRGVRDPDASLAAEAGVAILRVAFDRWVSEPEDQDLGRVMADMLEQLRRLTAAG